MLRSISAASVVAAALAFAPSAFAKPITTVEHFKAGKHRHVTDRVTVHTKTGVVDTHVKVTKLTKADVKETKTISEKETPTATGYTYAKTVTGFDGKSKTTTGTVSHSAASGGHGKA